MSQAKIKDRILSHAYGESSVAVQNIDGNTEDVQVALTELHNEGLVQIQHKGTNRGKTSIITYKITDLGTALVNSGGYTKSRVREKRKKYSANLSTAFWFIVAAIIGAIIDRIISLLF